MYQCEKSECNNFGILTSASKNQVCLRCGARYCSEICKKYEETTHKCIENTKEQIEYTLFLFGCTSVPEFLPKICSENIWPVPGPIQEPLPKSLIPIRDEKFFSLLSEDEKEMVLDTDWYYITPHSNIARLWDILTIEQRNTIRSLIDSAVENTK